MANIDKLLKKAQEHFQPNEVAESVVFGAYETKIMNADTVRNGIIVATNSRILFYGKRTFGFDLESFPYSNISSFEYGKDLMGKKISFFASGNKVKMKWINKGDVENFINLVQEKLAKKDSKPVATEVSVSDKLKQLATLRDEGIITEEEFAEKKKQLLELI
ncbi:PH domain-containing protein [Neobacillus mesonae]|nr:PH domain-containing protein [Neobacillus mesonae]